MRDGAVAELATELRDLELRRQQTGLVEPETSRRQTLLESLIQQLKHRPGAERRQHLRIPAELEVRFRMAGATIICVASELSQGGLGLRGHLWITEDQDLTVENLRLGSVDYPMEIKARVVWKLTGDNARPGAGLVFREVDEVGQRQIRSVFGRLFIAYLERLSAGAAID